MKNFVIISAILFVFVLSTSTAAESEYSNVTNLDQQIVTGSSQLVDTTNNQNPQAETGNNQLVETSNQNQQGETGTSELVETTNQNQVESGFTNQTSSIIVTNNTKTIITIIKTESTITRVNLLSLATKCREETEADIVAYSAEGKYFLASKLTIISVGFGFYEHRIKRDPTIQDEESSHKIYMEGLEKIRRKRQLLIDTFGNWTQNSDCFTRDQIVPFIETLLVNIQSLKLRIARKYTNPEISLECEYNELINLKIKYTKPEVLYRMRQTEVKNVAKQLKSIEFAYQEAVYRYEVDFALASEGKRTKILPKLSQLILPKISQIILPKRL